MCFIYSCFGVGFLDAISWRMQPSSWNFSDVDDPVLVKMVEDVRNSKDPTEKAKLQKETLMYVNSQHYVVSLPVRVSFTMWQPWLKGYSGETHLGPQNPGALWARVWIDKD